MTTADARPSDVTSGLPLGLRLRTSGRTVTEGEVSLLVNLAWTRGPLHTDREFARRSPFGNLILPGPLTVSLMSGLWATSGLLGRLEADHGVQLLAVLGGENRYVAPLTVGDTLRVEVELAAARATSRADRGILTLALEGINQHDDVIASVTEQVLFTRSAQP